MNIHRLIILFIALFCSELYSQETLTEPLKPVSSEFTNFELEKIQTRWEKYNPPVDVVLLNGATITGELLSACKTEIIIYSGKDIVPERSKTDEMVHISMTEIDRVHIRKGAFASIGIITGASIGGGIGIFFGTILAFSGSYFLPVLVATLSLAVGGSLGSKIQNVNRESVLKLDPGSSEYKIELAKLQKLAVFSDSSLVYPTDIHSMLMSSRLMRSGFPDKHLRISFTRSIGPNNYGNAIKEMLESTTFPSTEYHTIPPLIKGFELLDFSWRFSDRYIVGGQFIANFDTRNIFQTGYYNNEKYSYFYRFDFVSKNIYSEYAFRPLNRFFTKPYELLLGGGVIFASSSREVGYNSLSYYGEIPKETYPVYGAQLRTAFHYYLYPGFSLSAGLEGTFIENLSVPALSLPTSDPDIRISLPEHNLKFSSVIFKIGASIYF